MSTSPPFDITVIGLGAMGGGMARALMESSPTTKTVIGYDMQESLVDAFYQETVQAGKAAAQKPTVGNLSSAILPSTQFVVLVLQNEPQCQQVCFGNANGNNDADDCLIKLLSKDSCIILCSTVTPTWSKRASTLFTEAGMTFIDSPISGGPVRARNGDLSLFASCDDESIITGHAKPVLDCMSRSGELHLIQGGAGKGSTVKMVHQLLAGVHVVVTAEALALAAKTGLDVEQMYRIVNGAAGSSWMFQDRGQRMIQPDTKGEVKSQLQIFVKDLDIIYNEAKQVHAPIPIATAALQQFISAMGLGLAKEDDSRVKQVYEQITGVPIAASRQEGNGVNEYWKLEDKGTWEQIVEVGDEPRHNVLLVNEYIRAIRVEFPPNDTTLAHRHDQDSLYFFLVKDQLNVVNHIQGSLPCCDCMDYGEVRFGDHKSGKPLVHKITNKTNVPLLAIDAEILKTPPVTCPVPLVAEYHELIKTRDKCRVYKLTLEPGQSVTVTYTFFHCSVILEPSTVEKGISSNNDKLIAWTETLQQGDVAWKEPIMNMTKKNIGPTTFVEYIAEWR